MTLIELFTAIANAIRAKLGTSNPISAEDFATQIGTIPTGITPTGTIEITENGTVDVTNYAEANVNVSGGGDEYNAKVKLTLEKLSSTSSGAQTYITRLIEELPILSCENITSLNYSFYRARNLKKIAGFVNASNITDLASCFNECNNLIEAPTFDDLSAVTTMASTFRDDPNLEYIPIYNTPNLTNMSMTFNNSPKLTDESLNNIMATCINAPKVQSKKLSSIGLSSTQIAKCKTLSNYQAFLDAGWTA